MSVPPSYHPPSPSPNPTPPTARLRFAASTNPILPPPITHRPPGTPRGGVRRGLRRCLPLGNFLCAMFSISCFVFSVFLTMILVAVAPDAQVARGPAHLEKPGLLLLGHGQQLETKAHRLSVVWNVACDTPTMQSDPVLVDAELPGKCGPFDGPFDVYLNDPSKPAFSSNPVGDAPNTQDQFSFTTEHRIHKRGDWDPIQQLGDPFDHYDFSAFAFAMDPTTNRSIDITTFAVANTLGDFVLRSHDTPSTNNFTYNSGDRSVTAQIESRLLQVVIESSAIAKVFAICFSLVNWSLAVGSVYITALVASGELEATSVVAPLPLGAPLIILTIRSLYVGTPLFGASIDAVAFFVQLLIVALCSFVLLGVLTMG